VAHRHGALFSSLARIGFQAKGRSGGSERGGQLHPDVHRTKPDASALAIRGGIRDKQSIEIGNRRVPISKEGAD